jgi:hypothetical protein
MVGRIYEGKKEHFRNQSSNLIQKVKSSKDLVHENNEETINVHKLK